MNSSPRWRSEFDTTERSPFGTGNDAQSSAHSPVPDPYQVRWRLAPHSVRPSLVEKSTGSSKRVRLALASEGARM